VAAATGREEEGMEAVGGVGAGAVAGAVRPVARGLGTGAGTIGGATRPPAGQRTAPSIRREAGTVWSRLQWPQWSNRQYSTPSKLSRHRPAICLM
jgi:hypothetical protein